MKHEEMKKLVSDARRNNKKALDKLLCECYPQLYYYAYKQVQNEQTAQDICQDACVSIVKNISSLKEPSAFKAWSYQIVTNKAREYIKNTENELSLDENDSIESSFDLEAEDGSLPERAVEDKEFRELMQGMINALPEGQRMALLLFYYERMSVLEIAQIQGVSEGTVKSRLNYGRRAVKRQIEEYEQQNKIKLHGVSAILYYIFCGEAQSITTGLGISLPTGAGAAAGTAAASAAYSAISGALTYIVAIIVAVTAIGSVVLGFSHWNKFAGAKVGDDTSVSAGEEEIPETFDVWDGESKEPYARGSGEKDLPYEISSAAQLAYMSDEVCAGNTYQGKFFVLTVGIDLNKHEWTPIGHGDNSFMGSFDGRGHTVRNMNITESYVHSDNDASYVKKYYTQIGLFGSCLDATVKNLNIDSAFIETKEDMNLFSQSRVGFLMGRCWTKTASEIKNIKVVNSSIRVTGETTSFYFGGVFGLVTSMQGTKLDMGMLETDVDVMLENSRALEGGFGGIIGFISHASDLHISDLSSELHLNVEKTFASSSSQLSVGAIGSSYASGRQTTPFNISDVFSKVEIEFEQNSGSLKNFESHAGIGAQSIASVSNGSEQVYNLTNIFGYTEIHNKATGEKTLSTKLYDTVKADSDSAYRDSTYHINNCKGVTELPTDHGFDTRIWDVSDPTAPKLKRTVLK